MAIKTRDTSHLAEKIGNLYEATVILSKRARQVATHTKAELDTKLSYFEDFGLEPTDEIRTNEDQLRVSLEYERRAKPTEVAIEEMMEDEIYYRNPGLEEG
ncbi:MAG: DNA-directed RNA polymerase subunit omega [Bacteroidota bacterium]